MLGYGADFNRVSLQLVDSDTIPANAVNFVAEWHMGQPDLVTHVVSYLILHHTPDNAQLWYLQWRRDAALSDLQGVGLGWLL